MAESRIRRGKTKGFFTLYRDSAQDDRLSLEARGLFALMMSLPENWEYSVSGLAVKAGCGKDRIRRILGELQDVGYLIREQSHDSGGKFSGNVYVLQDEAPPLSGKPDNGGLGEMTPLSGNTVNGENRQRETPSSVFPTQKNIDLKEEEIKRPPKAPQGGRSAKRSRKRKSIPEWQPERFEGFWSAYPRDEDRAKAVEQWDLLPKDKELMDKHGGSEDALLREISRGLKRHLECEDWQDGKGIPYAFRWLRDRRWTEKQKQVHTAKSNHGSEPPEVRYGVR